MLYILNLVSNYSTPNKVLIFEHQTIVQKEILYEYIVH